MLFSLKKRLHLCADNAASENGFSLLLTKQLWLFL